MIIQLQGWCIDREIQVLSKMLEEADLPLIEGQFTVNGFETEEDVPVEVQEAIASYFAPGPPVIKISNEEKIYQLQDTLDTIVLSILEG